MRGRTLLYVLLALTVPTGAFALTGGGDEAPAPNPSLSVAASLDTCGIAADTVVCKIDASWNELPGATRYAASVARADGSVVDYGDVGAGSASFWVPYVGNGTYTVTVSAYGTPPGADKPEVIAKESSSAGGTREPGAVSAGGAPATGDAASVGDATATGAAPGDPGQPSCDEDPAEPGPDDPPADQPPQPPADQAAESTETERVGASGLSEPAAESLDDEAELPDSVDCPAN